MAPIETPNADTGETTDGNGQPVCKCGATTFTFKGGKKRCAKGHTLLGNADAAIHGKHSAEWRREHDAEIKAMADRLVRDYGHASLDAAPLSLQIIAIAVARTTMVADTAYWRMMDIGGPVAESGKERRAYRVWADSNSDLARDLKGVMGEMSKKLPPRAEDQFANLSIAELRALNASIAAQLDELEALEAQFAVRIEPDDAHLGYPDTRPPEDAALSRNPDTTSTAPQLAGASPSGSRRVDPTLGSRASSARPRSGEPRPEPTPIVYAYGKRVTESDVRTCMRDTGEEVAYAEGRISKADAYERTRRWMRAAMEMQ